MTRRGIMIFLVFTAWIFMLFDLTTDFFERPAISAADKQYFERAQQELSEGNPNAAWSSLGMAEAGMGEEVPQEFVELRNKIRVQLAEQYFQRAQQEFDAGRTFDAGTFLSVATEHLIMTGTYEEKLSEKFVILRKKVQTKAMEQDFNRAKQVFDEGRIEDAWRLLNGIEVRWGPRELPKKVIELRDKIKAELKFEE